MSPRKAVVWRQVVDELTNALQVAVGFAAQVRRNAQTTAGDTEQLEAAIERAVSALKRVQPSRRVPKRP
jgi:hypothetical protein